MRGLSGLVGAAVDDRCHIGLGCLRLVSSILKGITLKVLGSLLRYRNFFIEDRMSWPMFSHASIPV